jgi:hypothetical protein
MWQSCLAGVLIIYDAEPSILPMGQHCLAHQRGQQLRAWGCVHGPLMCWWKREVIRHMQGARYFFLPGLCVNQLNELHWQNANALVGVRAASSDCRTVLSFSLQPPGH